MRFIRPLFITAFLIACQSAPTPDESPNSAPSKDLRGFQDLGGVFAVNVADGQARLDAQGLHVNDALTIQLSSWGRHGNELDASAATVQWGDCTANARWLSDRSCAHSVELSRAGITEYWQPVNRGLEQGWNIVERPVGSGDLQIQVDFDHAAHWDVNPAGQSAQIVAGDGGRWSYAGLKVWDAHGEHFSAWMERSEHGVQLVVDDSGATYPITVDPILSADVALTPQDAEAHSFIGAPMSYGTSVTGVGDVNGDGFNDLLVGSPGWDVVYSFDRGSGYLYLGDSGGIDGAAGVNILGTNRTYMGSLGASSSGGGDLNGDGFDDVVLGSPTGGLGGVGHLFYGDVSGLDTSIEAFVEASDAWLFDKFGHDVSLVGDVNGDGFDDLLVGAPGNSDDGEQSGAAYLYLGSATGVSSLSEVKFTASDADVHHYFGSSVSGAGDVNGDGFDDILIGANGNGTNGSRSGAVYLYFGSSTGINPTIEFKLTPSDGSPDDFFGCSVANAGDVNADGFDDIAIGAYGSGNASITGGSTYVYLGGVSGVQAASETKIQGANTLTGDNFGHAVAGGFDANADGYDDIVVGAPEADHFGAQSGSVYLFFGSASGIVAASEQALSAPDAAAGDFLGSTVAGVADVDGDGYDDVLAGAPGKDVGIVPDAGSATLFHGGCEHIWYPDNDNDGYGAGAPIQDCSQPPGYVLDATDCDDSNPGINPGIPEICDANQVDEDCSGLADDNDTNVTETTAWYADNDLDGQGNLNAAVHLCISPLGYLPSFGDCDDTDATVFSGAAERCDGQLNDCDGAIDGDEVDEDADGYAICALDAGGWDGPETVWGGEDCDDTNASITPFANDLLGDGVDSDCDGWGGPTDDEDSDGLSWADEQAAGTTDNNPDADGDGLNDGDEVNVFGTNPLSNDSDADGLNDYEEVNNNGTNPNEADSDFDGLTDLDELAFGSDPNNPDSDADGLNDADEQSAGTNPNDPDSDADGLLDGEDDDPQVPLATTTTTTTTTTTPITPTTPNTTPTPNPSKSSGCSVVGTAPSTPLGALTMMALLSIRRQRRFVPE